MPAVISGTSGLVDQWLVGLLGADATLAGYGLTGVYKAVAPEGSAAPYIVLLDQGDIDTTGMATQYVLSTASYAIRCTDQADTDTRVVQMGHRVHTLVQGIGPGAYQDGYIYAAQRMSGLTLVEVDQGVQWRHRVQIFRIWVQEGS